LVSYRKVILISNAQAITVYQIVIWQNCSCNGILYSHHPKISVALCNRFGYGFEVGEIHDFNILSKITKCHLMVERAWYTLNGYFKLAHLLQIFQNGSQPK